MNKLRKTLAIWITKATIWASKLLGKKGTSTPGKIALKIYPNILKELASKVKNDIIVVCGTNGKTTTNNMIYTMLTSNKYSVVCNNVGANMLEGVTTAFIAHTNFWGDLNADYATIEVDEASTVKVFDHLTPSKIIITNIFRDQLDRYGEIDITIKLLQKALLKAPNAQLILNGDDPLTASFGHNTNRKCTYFGIHEDLNININETKEGRFCTICGKELKYNYYHYSQLGDFYCPHCGFKRPALDFKAFNIDAKENLKFKVAYDSLLDYSEHAACLEDEATNQQIASFNINYHGFYNIYNVLASMCVATLTGIDIHTINNALNKYEPQIGRMECFNLKKPTILNLSKNPAGFNQAISTVLQDHRDKNILIIINDNAQDGKDISWIWDVDFERLNIPNIKNYIISGIRRKDVAVRFKYASFDMSKVNIEKDIQSAVISLINKTGDVCYILVNYTALFSTQNILQKLEKSKKWR